MTIHKDSLSYRLNLALKQQQVSQSELARQIGAKPQSIQYICSNNVQKSRYTYDIAKVLKVSYEWLATGMGSMVYENSILAEDIVTYKTPILVDEQLTHFIECNYDSLTIRSQDFVITNLKVPSSTIAYRLTDDSMEPQFNRHSIVIIDYRQSNKHQDYVLAYIHRIKQYVVRQLHRSDHEFILKPLNAHLYKKIPMDKEDQIIGPVIQGIQLFPNRADF